MQGWAEYLICEVERLPDELSKPFKDNPNPEGTIVIQLTFEPPPNIEEASAEIERLQRDKHEWVEEY